MSAFVETHRGVAHPWLCDAMGHLNTRHHAGMFDDGLMHFLTLLGYRFSWVDERRQGWADVRQEMEFQSEVSKGAMLLISSVVEKVGRTSLTTQHRMINTESLLKVATMRSITVYLDLREKRPMELPPAIRKEAEARLISSKEDS